MQMEHPVLGKMPRKASIPCPLRAFAHGGGERQLRRSHVPLASGEDKYYPLRHYIQQGFWLRERSTRWFEGVGEIAPARLKAYLCEHIA